MSYASARADASSIQTTSTNAELQRLAAAVVTLSRAAEQDIKKLETEIKKLKTKLRNA
jgi:glutamate-1-semialdehyde aminotransferase